MSERLNTEGVSNNRMDWTKITEEVASHDEQHDKAVKEIQTKINAAKQRIRDIQNGASENPRRRDENEPEEEYDEYICSYLQGEVLIEKEKKKSESRAECAERLIGYYESKLKQLITELG